VKITDIRADTLSIGPTVLRVFTDEGVVGLSEIGWHDAAMFRPHLENVIKPLLVGESPLEPGRHWERLYFGTPERPYPTPASYVGAIDVALWDIVGKVAGLPIHALLGGAARTEIPLYWSTGAGWQRTPQQMLDALRAGWDQGFRAFKIRMDWGPLRFDVDPAKDLEMFRLCRDFVGSDTWLGFDANRGYSVGTAIGQGRRFEELGIAHFEEPLPPYDWPGVRQVADALDVPISTGEGEATRWTFRDLIAIGNPDILQPDILDAGGLSEAMRIFQLAEVHAKPVMPHSPAAGILLMASLHAYATVPSGVRPHEYSVEYGPSPDQLAELLGEAVLPREGRIGLPAGPGLGLELSQRALERLTAAG
jgi:L-alanine-DL-glutamate epimerase-like enolase superfamily enzyme